MSIRSALSSLRAWFAGLSTKEQTMDLTSPVVLLSVGGNTQLTSSNAATFTTSNPSVVTVDASGIATAIAVGSVTITAVSVSDPSLTATIDLAVVAAPVVPVAVAEVDEAVEAPAPTELEQLEALIDKLSLTTVKEVKAAIGFIRALV